MFETCIRRPALHNQAVSSTRSREKDGSKRPGHPIGAACDVMSGRAGLGLKTLSSWLDTDFRQSKSDYTLRCCIPSSPHPHLFRCFFARSARLAAGGLAHEQHKLTPCTHCTAKFPTSLIPNSTWSKTARPVGHPISSPQDPRRDPSHRRPTPHHLR